MTVASVKRHQSVMQPWFTRAGIPVPPHPPPRLPRIPSRMSLSAIHRPYSTAQDLARLLCGWLMAVLLLQGLAASLVLVRGAAHRHAAESTAWHTAGPTPAAHSHAVAHAAGTPHHHADVHALAVPADGSSSGLEAATLVLVAALVSEAPLRGWALDELRHALPEYVARWLPSHAAEVPHKPPRG